MKKPKTPRKRPAGEPKAASRTPAAIPAAAPKARAPTYDDLLAIVRLIESGSRFSEFRLRSGEIEVEVKRANGVVVPQAPPVLPASVAAAQAGAQPPAPSTPAANAGNWAPASAGATTVGAGTTVIRSPMVGTFYRAPEPGAAPFVEPGSRVQPDTIVCIIEVMKLMNSVAAGVSGVVTHVFVDNAQLVEHGQPLIAIRPDP